MIDLVKALNVHVTTPNWNKDVATKLEKMVGAVRTQAGAKTAEVGNIEMAGRCLCS